MSHPFRPLAGLLLTLSVVASAARADDVAALQSQAEAGDAQAQVRLGYALRDGGGTRRSPKAAAFWFGQAADQGNVEAIDNLGWLHEQGLGLKADPAKARQLYARAAEAGHAQAQYNLGRCLKEGIGGPADAGAALEWLSRAGKAGHGPALAQALQLVAAGMAPAPGLLEAAAGVRDADGQFRLGLIHLEGLAGMKADPARAAACFARARELGMPAERLDPAQAAALAARAPSAGAYAFLPLKHLDQGWNMCAPTSSAMVLARATGKPVDPYAIKKRCPDSPAGTGTAWDKLLQGVKAESGRTWEIRTFAFDDAGFAAGLALIRAELDAGRCVPIDVRGADAQGGAHTVAVCGYDDDAKQVFIQDPAICAPGVRAVPEAEFQRRWNSQWFVSNASGAVLRPLILTGGK